MVSQVPEDTRKMIARTATAVAATAQPRQITDAQVTAGFQAAGFRAAAQAPEDHRGLPVLPDRLALQGPQEPPALREPRALQGPPVLRGPLVLPGLLAQLEKHKL